MSIGPIIPKLGPDRADEGLRIAYHPLDFGDYKLELQLTGDGLERAMKANSDFEVPTEPIILARYKKSTRTLTTYPVGTTFGAYFLEPKYLHLKTLILEGVVSPMVAMEDGDYLYYEELPNGIIREPLAGFGLAFDMRFIVESAERQSGVTTLRFSEDKGVSRKGDTLSMSYSLFKRLRRDINRTHRRSLDLANKAKREYLDATLNLMLDPEFELPIGDGTAKPVADILAETLIGRSRSAEAEAKAAARTVKKSVKTLAEKEPAELLDLRREIELVSLEELIELFEKKLGQAGLQERHWQEFFNGNAFVLQLAFNLPALAFGDQVAVGGTKFDGSGGKLADYAIKLGLFGNLALIEIKTPKTTLLERKTYRGGVHAPSQELVGAVTQILDQRHQLQNEINSKKVASKAYDVFTYAVPCIVIAGCEPATDDEKKSFELYRNNLRDVIVITFHELLAKLKALHAFLSKPPSTVAPATDTLTR
ncbi:Shedu immune nuclease family protein [Mesorhizobium temperatum]|nr:Shedu immune nuclease family protein [Mesorhizobium temperatum]